MAIEKRRFAVTDTSKVRGWLEENQFGVARMPSYCEHFPNEDGFQDSAARSRRISLLQQRSHGAMLVDPDGPCLQMKFASQFSDNKPGTRRGRRSSRSQEATAFLRCQQEWPTLCPAAQQGLHACQAPAGGVVRAPALGERGRGAIETYVRARKLARPNPLAWVPGMKPG